ncbi:MAG: archaeal heat shock protein Hsp20 [Candidatus Njordarchaeota archaeon]
MAKDDDKKRKKPYKDFDEVINKIFEDFFGKPVRISDIFNEFNRLIQEFFENFDKFQNEYFMPSQKRPRIKRYTWGFSIVVPPGGVPRIYRFGNVRPSEKERGKIERTEEFEPLASVFEEDGLIKVIIDLPGVDEESIKIDAHEDKVIVKAQGADRKYYKEIELPTKVDPNPVNVAYRNGILELVFKKK